MNKYGHLSCIALVVAALATSTGCSRTVEPVDFDTTIVKGINFIGLSVQDLSATEAFYREPANLETVRQDVITDSAFLSELTGRTDLNASTRLLRSANGQVLLMHFANRTAPAASTPAVTVNGLGFAHICHQVDSRTEAYQKLLANGAEVIGAEEMVQLSSRNPVKYAYVRDPNAAMVEVEHVDVAALELPTPPKNTHRMRHIALVTQDYGRAVEFYADFLEQPSPRRLGRFFALRGDKLDMVSGLPESRLRMAFFQVRNMELEIAQYISHPIELPTQPRPVDSNGYNMIVFDVRDLDEAARHFVAAGGTLIGDPTDLLGETTQFGRDPDGNLIGLQASNAGSDYSAKNFADNGI